MSGFKLLPILLVLCHLAASAEERVNLICEVQTTDGVKSISLEKEISAEKHDDGTYRVEEDLYDNAVDECDRHNAYSGKILPSIIGKVGSLLFPLGSKQRKANYQQAKAKHTQVQRDPEKTMVVFFHGTGSNPITDLNSSAFPSYDEEEKGGGELLSFLQHRMAENGAEQGVDYIALHGVGSGNLQITNLHSKFMAKDAYSWRDGTGFGSGAYENVENAILHLKGITKNPALEAIMAKQTKDIKRVSKLIVFGWSRGAVTAIQFATELYLDPELKDLDVHLFVIDAVPGLGNISFASWKNIFHLYPNVKTYFGAYAENERSMGFTPLVPRVADSSDLFSRNRKAMIIGEFPGNHGTLVGNIWNQKTRTDSARTITSFAAQARIMRGLAQAFIVSHGGFLTGIEYHAGRPSSTMDEIAKFTLQDFETVLKNLSEF